VKILVLACVVLLSVSSAALAQPAVFANGMVNAASSVPAGLPSGDIAQGSMFSIYGSNMGPATSPALSWPLHSQQGLGGVTVQVTDSASQMRYAILLFVGPGQINAVLPSATATGRASLTVTYNGQTGASQTFNVVQRSVGLLAWNQQGSGPGVIQQYHGAGFAFNDIATSAIPGDVGVLWGTGLGPVTFDETQVPVQSDLHAGAEVWVGGQRVDAANVQYQGRSSAAGQDQVNFVIPNIPGCYVPVFVKIGNVVSNTVTMAISANAGMCSDALSFSGLDPAYVKAHGLKQGYVSVNWSTMKVPVIGDMVSNSASGTFYGYDWARLSQSRGQFGVSTYGSCTILPFRGASATNPDPAPDALDAGNLTLTGPDSVARPFTSSEKGSYSISSLPFTTNPSGNFTVTGQGGANVGAFTSTLTLPQAFVWTNVDAITQVTRANGVTVNWTGGAGLVTIIGMSMIDTPQQAGATFLCIEQASKGTFTVPPAVLLALPASVTSDGFPLGSLTVMNQPAVVPFTPNPPTGLDVGNFSATFATFKTLGYN
jgi:uncharacterized protein (TIGR03437 family)